MGDQVFTSGIWMVIVWRGGGNAGVKGKERGKPGDAVGRPRRQEGGLSWVWEDVWDLAFLGSLFSVCVDVVKTVWLAWSSQAVQVEIQGFPGHGGKGLTEQGFFINPAFIYVCRRFFPLSVFFFLFAKSGYCIVCLRPFPVRSVRARCCLMLLPYVYENKTKRQSYSIYKTYIHH